MIQRKPLAWAACLFLVVQGAADRLLAADELTPLVMKTLAAPHPVTGADGKTHLVYELLLSNATPLSWTIKRIDFLDPDGDVSVAALEGDALSARLSVLGTRTPATEAGPGQTLIVWVHLSLDDGQPVPRRLTHHVTLAAGDKSFEQTGAEIEVSPDAPVTLGPPLTGKGWVAADGCCDSIRHVRAMLTVDGALYLAQRFAIDWELMDGGHRLFVGDPKQVESYFCFGKPVLAVADATVVRAVDRFQNRVPGKLPDDITLEEADGNHIVLDLGEGRYALYSHLQPASVQVQEGDRVRRGQVIARVGNTGNTSAPHLHFHVMDAPSPLAANGLPYIIDQFEVRGVGRSTDNFDQAEAEGTPIDVLPVDPSGERHNVLPMDLMIIDFPDS